GLEKLRGGVTGEIDFLLHAVADVENDAEAHRRHFTRKVPDLLFDLVFEQLEVVDFQVGDESVRVPNSHVDHDKVDSQLQRFLRREDDSRCEKDANKNANLPSKSHRCGRHYHSRGRYSSGSSIAAGLKTTPHLGLR